MVFIAKSNFAMLIAMVNNAFCFLYEDKELTYLGLKGYDTVKEGTYYMPMSGITLKVYLKQFTTKYLSHKYKYQLEKN